MTTTTTRFTYCTRLDYASMRWGFEITDAASGEIVERTLLPLSAGLFDVRVAAQARAAALNGGAA